MKKKDIESMRKKAEKALIEECAKFIFAYSNLCWNLAEKGEYKRAQEMGVDELIRRMPRLCREFLAHLTVPGSSFEDTVAIIDEAFCMSKKDKKKCAAKRSAKVKPAKAKTTRKPTKAKK